MERHERRAAMTEIRFPRCTSCNAQYWGPGRTVCARCWTGEPWEYEGISEEGFRVRGRWVEAENRRAEADYYREVLEQG